MRNLKALPVRSKTGPQVKEKRDFVTLVSVQQLYDSGMDVHFTKTKVTVTNATGKTVLEGNRDPLRNLYMVPISDPISDPQPIQSQAIKMDRQHSRLIRAVPALISYLHAAAGY